MLKWSTIARSYTAVMSVCVGGGAKLHVELTTIVPCLQDLYMKYNIFGVLMATSDNLIV